MIYFALFHLPHDLTLILIERGGRGGGDASLFKPLDLRYHTDYYFVSQISRLNSSSEILTTPLRNVALGFSLPVLRQVVLSNSSFVQDSSM